MAFISFSGTGNVDKMSEFQFVLPHNKREHVHIFTAHISETCGFIFNKIGMHEFFVILFSISKSKIRNSRWRVQHGRRENGPNMRIFFQIHTGHMTNGLHGALLDFVPESSELNMADPIWLPLN